MVAIAYYLIDGAPGGTWGSFDNMRRAEQLLAQARALEPGSATVLNTTVFWLRSVGRCAEVIEAAERAIRIDPNRTRTHTGRHIQSSLPCARHGRDTPRRSWRSGAGADQLNPRSTCKSSRYRHMGFASLLLGRDQDAIAFLRRSLAMDPEGQALRWTYRMLAAAYARTGQIDEARRWLSAAVSYGRTAPCAAFIRKS